MKIGILTYHRAHNYGAILQAIGTRVFLKKHGYDSYYIDYYPDYHKQMYLPFSIKEIFNLGLRNGFFYIKNHILYWSDCKLRYNNFENFVKENISPFCKSVNERYDIVIYGSDQIWRQQRCGIGYNPIYFGDHSINARYKISYAASMGNIPSAKEEDSVCNLCKNFDSISVREKTLKDYLEKKGLNNVFLCLDPSLLLNMNDWTPYLKQVSIKRNYVLLYHLQPNAFDIEQAKAFAKRLGCDLKIIQGKVNRSSDMFDCVSGPGEFLSLISNARCVLSSSFHGVAFSIIFNKPFWASLVRNYERVTGLLEQLEIGSCFIDGNNMAHLSLPVIDYHKVNERIKTLRAESEHYLLSRISDYATKAYL